MPNITNFFEDILKNKTKITNASSGIGFEDNIKAYLRKHSINSISMDDKILTKYLKEIKPLIQAKSGNTLIKNTLYEQTRATFGDMYKEFYIWQPFGTQNYPDFLIFSESKIWSVEIKYSTKNKQKPLWNGNLPKQNALYIFGSFEKRDLTFFRGEDILPENERIMLLDFWAALDEVKNEWEQKFSKNIGNKSIANSYGFQPYIRKAYFQGKNFNKDAEIDFFKNKNRSTLEQNLIAFTKM